MGILYVLDVQHSRYVWMKTPSNKTGGAASKKHSSEPLPERLRMDTEAKVELKS